MTNFVAELRYFFKRLRGCFNNNFTEILKHLLVLQLSNGTIHIEQLAFNV